MEETEPPQSDEAENDVETESPDVETVILRSAAQGWAGYVGPELSGMSLEETVDHALEYSKAYLFKFFIGCCAKITLDLDEHEDVSDDLADKIIELTERISDRMVALDYNSCDYDKDVRLAFLDILQVIVERLTERQLINHELITDVADYQIMGPASAQPAPDSQMYWPLGPAFWEVTEDDR